jgi:hypothetical protein
MSRVAQNIAAESFGAKSPASILLKTNASVSTRRKLSSAGPRHFHLRRSDDPMSKTILAAVAILLVTSAAQAQTRTAVKVCGKEIETHCGKVQAGGGAVRDCINAHLKEFSPACQAAFTRVATAAKACATDTKQNCAGVKPGGGRIEVCLKAHLNALSADCKAALSGSPPGRT